MQTPGPTRVFERALRRGLAGLPRPDVDDFVEEALTHIAENRSHGMSEADAIAAFGAPAVVAAEVVARRIEATAVSASTTRRVLAGIADTVLGWGPFAANPLWFFALTWFTERVVLSPEDLPSGTSVPSPGIPAWSVVVTVLFAAWGVYYWRVLRSRGSSVGARMVGITPLPDGERRRWYLTASVAQSPPARIVSTPKWYLAAPLLGVVVTTAGFVVFGVAMTALALTEPWGSARETTEAVDDWNRSEQVLDQFFSAIIEGDAEKARRLAVPGAVEDVDALLERAAANDVARAERGMSVDDIAWEMHQYDGTGRPVGIVVVTLERSDGSDTPGEYSTRYRVSAIEFTDRK